MNVGLGGAHGDGWWAATWIEPLLWGAALSSIVALAGRRFEALSPGGARAAVGVGSLVFAAGGVRWAALLLLFFASGSVLSRAGRRGGVVEVDGGGLGQRAQGRNAFQVLANGGVAAAAGLLRIASGAAPVWDALVAGSLAAMTADTWATEVGLWSGARPRLLVGGRHVEPGVSGAVSVPGTLAGVAGALAMATLAAAVFRSPHLAVGVAAGGVLGLLADSVLGSCVQARYRCEACGRAVEDAGRHLTHCRGPVRHERGVRWIDNNVVNALAASFGAGITALALLGG